MFYKMQVSWTCVKWWRRILQRFYINIHHCFREANGAADFLAKQGGRIHQNVVYHGFTELTRELRGICNLDSWGVPSVRSRKSIS